MPTATVLSDLSANIFAALLLILILLLQVKVAAAPRPVPDRPVDVAEATGLRARRPLGAAEIVATLRDRGPGQPGASLDLTATGVRAADGSLLPGAALAARLPEILGRARDGGPVRLYVFSNRWFAAATDALTHAGFDWRDLSVPRALRRADDPDAWSAAFLRLAAAGGDVGAFRDGLAHLLAATPAPLVAGGRVTSGSAGERPADGESSGGGGAGAFSLAALLHTLGIAVAVLALTGGAALVAMIEGFLRHPALHRRTRPADGGTERPI